VTVGVLGAEIAGAAVDGGMAATCVWSCDSTGDAAAILKERVVNGDALLVKASRGKRLETVISEMMDGMGKD